MTTSKLAKQLCAVNQRVREILEDVPPEQDPLSAAAAAAVVYLEDNVRPGLIVAYLRLLGMQLGEAEGGVRAEIEGDMKIRLGVQFGATLQRLRPGADCSFLRE